MAFSLCVWERQGVTQLVQDILTVSTVVVCEKKIWYAVSTLWWKGTKKCFFFGSVGMLPNCSISLNLGVNGVIAF